MLRPETPETNNPRQEPRRTYTYRKKLEHLLTVLSYVKGIYGPTQSSVGINLSWGLAC